MNAGNFIILTRSQDTWTKSLIVSGAETALLNLPVEIKKRYFAKFAASIRLKSMVMYEGHKSEALKNQIFRFDSGKNKKAICLRNDRSGVNHSYDFNWGYGGSGPAQTSFAIIYDYLRYKSKKPLYSNNLAHCLYQDFKWKIIVHKKENHIKISEEQILNFLKKWRIRADKKFPHLVDHYDKVKKLIPELVSVQEETDTTLK